MGAGRLLLNVLVVLVAIAGGFYQFKLKPILRKLGVGRVIDPVGNTDCTTVPELQACEKIVLHQPSGILYLACSTPESRVHWLPHSLTFNETGTRRDDYVATYDPKTHKVTKLKMNGFTSERGLSTHGMDVVPSSSDPAELYVYLINHRAPLSGLDPNEVGADSSVEIFRTALGSSSMDYIRTVEDPLIATPNDVTGSADGKEFWVTNDHGAKTGLAREFDVLGRAVTSVVYCHENDGCKYAIQHMRGNNGITQASNGTFYVVNSPGGQLYVLDKQADNTLIMTDVIEADRSMDNVMVDSEGHVWAAAFPKVLVLVHEHFKNPSIPSPSSALRFSINTGPGMFYGEKFKVDRVFEDDGSIASGVTSAAYDAERNRLFLHGLASPHLTICRL
ncbi:hypothetical protein NMY22_g8948 [Coprinellus aureogranulatus]|nr:hypothetical protein NMY22_g8948 [Coprinellus aureogranulatus]